MSGGDLGAGRLRWALPARTLVPAEDTAGVRCPLVVDSWLVVDGRARGVGWHVERFAAACASVGGLPPGGTRMFAAAALAALAGVAPEGRWWPRLELYGRAAGWDLAVWLRPAPAPSPAVRLWVDPRPDRRRLPCFKGPDLQRLTRLRQLAGRAGADEAVIVDADGVVLEGATTSLLWWRGDTLCAPPAGPHLLDSVTRRLLVAAAAIRGPVAFERCRPEALDGREVWAVNALHGIRPVVGWPGTAWVPGDADRAPAWAARLQAMAVPLANVSRK